MTAIMKQFIFPIIGILLFLTFYGAYLMKIQMQKKQGITVNRIAKGEKPKLTFIIEIFLKIATYGMLVVQIVSLAVSFFFQNGDYGWWLLLPGMVWRIIGSLIGATGIGMVIKAMADMKNSWRAGIDEAEQTALITTGIYRFSRNPAFVGFDLFYVGYALLFSNPLQLLFSLLAVYTLHLQILQEEHFLRKRFGEEYLAYRKKTRRYL